MAQINRGIAAALFAVAACRSADRADDKTPAPSAKPPATVADDPWGKAPAVAVDASDPDLAMMIELAQNGPDREYPQADAVVAIDRDDISLAADGTVVERKKQIVKILDAQRGKAKFADVHVPFDSARQTLDIRVARTVNADGKPRVVSPDEISDIVPPRLADATIYSDVRERVVSFTAVDRGSVIELEYTRTTRATPDAPLGGERLLATWDPILDRTVTITAPASTPVNVAVDNVDLRPSEATRGDTRVWTLHLAKQPDRHPESGSPIDAAVLPRVVFGFQPSWSRVVAPVAERFVRAAVPTPIPDAVKRQADAIVAGAKSDDDKAQRLFAFVAHDIRSVDLPLGWAGYQPHAPDVVLANRYADERDKVGLLLALAASQGIAGAPVFVRTGKVAVLDAVPTLAQFDRVVARLAVGGKQVWLDPIDETARYDVVFAGQDNLVLPIETGGELGRRPALDPSTSIAQVTATYKLSANGDLDATTTRALTGYYADRAVAELRPLRGENLDRRFQDEAAELSAAAIAKDHAIGDLEAVSGAFAVKDRVVAPGYAVAQGELRVFELPRVRANAAVPDLSNRKYPLYVGTPRIERAERTLEVPAGWKVAYVPPKLDGNATGVAYTSECVAKGQLVTCRDEIKLDALVVPVDKYAAYRSALVQLDAYERRIVVLVKS
jgi:hypothetical protein